MKFVKNSEYPRLRYPCVFSLPVVRYLLFVLSVKGVSIAPTTPYSSQVSKRLVSTHEVDPTGVLVAKGVVPTSDKLFLTAMPAVQRLKMLLLSCSSHRWKDPAMKCPQGAQWISGEDSLCVLKGLLAQQALFCAPTVVRTLPAPAHPLDCAAGKTCVRLWRRARSASRGGCGSARSAASSSRPRSISTSTWPTGDVLPGQSARQQWWSLPWKKPQIEHGATSRTPLAHASPSFGCVADRAVTDAGVTWASRWEGGRRVSMASVGLLYHPSRVTIHEKQTVYIHAVLCVLRYP